MFTRFVFALIDASLGWVKSVKTSHAKKGRRASITMDRDVVSKTAKRELIAAAGWTVSRLVMAAECVLLTSAQAVSMTSIVRQDRSAKQINAHPLNRTLLKVLMVAAVMIHTAKAVPVAILMASVVVAGGATRGKV